MFRFLVNPLNCSSTLIQSHYFSFSTDEEDRIGMERTFIEACKRLQSTAVELTPDMTGLEITSPPRDYLERAEKKVHEMRQEKDKGRRPHRRSISHSYHEVTSEPEPDAQGLHRRIDQLGR